MSIFSFFFGPSDGGPLPYPDNSPEGLAARWVRWAASASRELNPIADTTGRLAASNQPSDVWFLAGCFGGVVRRTCTIPARKSIFLPAFNMWFVDAKAPPRNDEMRAFGYLRVDGIKIELDVIATPKPFVLKGVSGNPVTGTSWRVNAVTWGLWKLLLPLNPGNHEIVFGGGDGYGFKVDATYYVRVESD